LDAEIGRRASRHSKDAIPKGSHGAKRCPDERASDSRRDPSLHGIFREGAGDINPPVPMYTQSSLDFGQARRYAIGKSGGCGFHGLG
jgi:hypothetical protein